MPLIWLLVGILIGLLVSRFIFKDTATFEYHMDKDVKADVKLSVYYCKECRIITAEW